MRKVAQPTCPVCESSGEEAYVDLRDRLFGAPEHWRMTRCDNARCGSYWLDPAPAHEDLPRAYDGYYTHSQGDEVRRSAGLRLDIREAYLARHLGYPFRKSVVARLLSRLVSVMPERTHSWLYSYFYLPWIADGRLLEIGSGSGWQLELMKAAGWQVTGLDFDPDAVAAARKRGLDMRLGDVRGMDFEAGSFDGIVMAHVMEHVFDPVGLLSECHRLLKPGGRLISITPNARSLGHRRFRAAWRGLEPPRHITVFTPDSLKLASERAGLQVEHVRVTARDAANLLLASRRTRDAAADTQIERPRFGEAPPFALRAMASLERLGNHLGLAWGEELVLVARR